MDLTQFVIIITTVTLSSLLVLLGVQVFFILKEIRISIKKVNKILDDSGRVSGTVGDSVSNFSGFVNGLKAGISTVTSFRKEKGDNYGE
jgi:hypothetical protein